MCAKSPPLNGIAEEYVQTVVMPVKHSPQSSSRLSERISSSPLHQAHDEEPSFAQCYTSPKETRDSPTPFTPAFSDAGSASPNDSPCLRLSEKMSSRRKEAKMCDAVFSSPYSPTIRLNQRQASSSKRRRSFYDFEMFSDLRKRYDPSKVFFEMQSARKPDYSTPFYPTDFLNETCSIGSTISRPKILVIDTCALEPPYTGNYALKDRPLYRAMQTRADMKTVDSKLEAVDKIRLGPHAIIVIGCAIATWPSKIITELKKYVFGGGTVIFTFESDDQFDALAAVANRRLLRETFGLDWLLSSRRESQVYLNRMFRSGDGSIEEIGNKEPDPDPDRDLPSTIDATFRFLRQVSPWDAMYVADTAENHRELPAVQCSSECAAVLTNIGLGRVGYIGAIDAFRCVQPSQYLFFVMCGLLAVRLHRITKNLSVDLPQKHRERIERSYALAAPTKLDPGLGRCWQVADYIHDFPRTPEAIAQMKRILKEEKRKRMLEKRQRREKSGYEADVESEDESEDENDDHFEMSDYEGLFAEWSSRGRQKKATFL